MRAGRERCPRCRAYVIYEQPAASAPSGVASRRLQWIALGLVGAFVVTVGLLWLTREPEPEPVAVPAHPADPLASRRAPKVAPQVSAGEVSTAAPKTPPFLEPGGAGAIAYHDGDYDSALRQFQAAIERNPQDAEALSNLGQVLVRLGRAAEAIPYYDRAIQLVPSRWAYHFNRARALGLTGKWDDAVASYRKAQELFPGDYATAFNLGLALHKKGDEEAAVEEYKKAIELNPDDGSFRLALGNSYERLQKRAEAAAAYQEYLRLSPSTPDADKVRARIALLTGATSSGASSGESPGPG
jgi:tetratricopeptide (TPR) repeat protein